MLLRKEKWSICSGKHYYTAIAESSIGRKGGLQLRIEGNDDAAEGLAVNIRTCYVGCCDFVSPFRVWH